MASLEGAERARRAQQRRPAAHGRTNVRARFLEQLIERAQVELTTTELLIGTAGLAAAAFLAGLVLSGAVAAGALALAALVAPFFWLRWRYGRRLDLFNQQLSGTIDILGAAVRAGHGLTRAFELVATEAPEPTRSGFALTMREIGFGVSREEALQRLLERYPSDDLGVMVAAINIQEKVGGSLPRVLETIAATVRERQRMEREVRSLTAQQRYSAHLLTALPILATAAMFMLSPDYVAPLVETGPGRLALGVAFTLIGLSFVIMRQLGKVDV